MGYSRRAIIAVIIANAIVLAAGLVAIMIACIQYQTAWPLLSVLVIFMSIIMPIICGGCTVTGGSGGGGDVSWLEDDDSGGVGGDCGADLAWVMLGMFVVAAYAVSVELYIGGVIPAMGVYLTLGGITVIQVTVLIFVRAVYFKKSDELAYMM